MGHSGQMGGEVQGGGDSQVGGEIVLWHPSEKINPPLARAVHALVIEQSGSGRTG
jgi:hypothetical protein